MKMDELRKLLHLIETDDVDEGLSIELKSHFAHPNPQRFKLKDEQRWVVKLEKKEIVFHGETALQNYFRQICLKTIAAFLNTSGGKLFIGVSDNINEDGKRKIFGINQAENFSRDKYKLDLLNHLENVFTQNYVSKYINIDFVSIGKPCVCVVDVKPITNDLPALVTVENKKEVLFVRLDNKTVQKTSTKDLILFGRDFWTRNLTSRSAGDTTQVQVPNGWSGPFELVSVELDHGSKVIALNVRERARPILCKFSNKFQSLSNICKSLEGKTVILSSTGRFTVHGGYFSDIQPWQQT